MNEQIVIPENWIDDPPDDPHVIVAIMEKYGDSIQNQTLEGSALRILFERIKKHYATIRQQVKDRDPQAFFKPSLEQSLLLNAWMWGVSFPICFSANRIGKTVAFIVNAILWMYPNNPQWKMFQQYTDEFSQSVQVVPRPSISSLLRIQDFFLENPQLAGDPRLSHLEEPNRSKLKSILIMAPELFQPVWPSPPIDHGCQIWLGAPDNDFHKRIFMRRWRELLPKPILRDSELDRTFTVSTASSTNPKTTVHEIVCKSYESEETKWAGDAVDGIILTEGFDERILDEIKPRIVNNGFMSWDYTPAEPRNVGRKVALAHKVATHKVELPLKTFIFNKFSVRRAPSHIIPKEKKADLIRMYDGKPEGIARLDGDFFASSGLILANLDKDFHCLTLSLEEVMAMFPNGRIFRGIDPGWDHPTSCVWSYMTTTNVHFIFQVYSERQKTISERCKDIIEWSNNEQEKFTRGNQTFFREVHTKPNSMVVSASATDFHTFKSDETTGQCYANQYYNEGLIISESIHMLPKERAVKADTMLQRLPYSPHPITNKPPGCKVFFLINGRGVASMLDKFDNLFWDRYRGGENKGEPKDEVPIHGDDEFDAFCYIVCAPLAWNAYQPKRREPRDAEPEFVKTPQSSQMERIDREQLAAPQAGRPGHFGS